MRYDFENRKTGKVKEYQMPMAEYDDFVKAHPELQRLYNTVPAVVNADSIGRRNMKVPSDFKSILDRAKKNKSKRTGQMFDNRGTRYAEMANKTEI